jgi:hypothetical protein
MMAIALQLANARRLATGSDLRRAALGHRIRRIAEKKNRKELPSWLNEFLLKRSYMRGGVFAHLF